MPHRNALSCLQILDARDVLDASDSIGSEELLIPPLRVYRICGNADLVSRPFQREDERCLPQESNT